MVFGKIFMKKVPTLAIVIPPYPLRYDQHVQRPDIAAFWG